ncbi:MAG: hypothetical protein C6P35_03310 [Cohnella sp.]|uniref:phage tail spike protein n=1 Tax=Cohnella sp. TaxID=1883426 RepID=UPI000E3A358C|nr:phage tail spike protein [Cohnella sp.]REK68011.1 MAG: hypothetical protein C6P35_03310 [Cohnella sp.]
MASKFRSRLQIWTPSGRLGTLADAFDIRVREVVNGDYYTQFIYPRLEDDAERYGALTIGNDVVFPSDVERGQRFRIRNVQEVREGRRIYKVVEAHHIAYTLGNYYLDDYIDFAAAQTPEQLLARLADGTPFTFVVEGNFEPQDVWEWGEDNKINLLQQARELFGAELAFDNYTITFTTRKGGNYGARVRYRHNMKGIKRTSHDMERITRLYGYGKNGLTIEGYQGRTVKYIDSQYFDLNNPFMGKMEWPDIDDQGKLLQEMQKHLKKYELPATTYEVDFLEMEKADPEFEQERIREAGDTVTCFDDVLGYSFDARAMEYDRYPFEPKRGRAVLANFREMKTSDYIFQATVGSKKAIQYTTQNAVLKGVKYDDSITLVDGLGIKVSDDQNREMVRLGQIGPGQYGQVMYNKSGAKTLWQDANTGDAHFAGILNAAGGTFSGALQAASGTFTGTVQAGTIIGGTISGSAVNGVTISGGTITGSLIQTSASYPRIELSTTGNLLGAFYDPNNSIRIHPFLTDGPYLEFVSGGIRNGGAYASAGDFYLTATNNNLRITAWNDIWLSPFFGGVKVDSWSKLFSVGDNQSLQAILNGKANIVHTHSISNIIGLQDALDAKANSTYVYSSVVANAAFDSSTRNLKLYAPNGATLATINIP